MEELVQRVKDGDKAAFEELVTTHQRGVYTLALRHTGNHDDALDISQEAFFRAYKGIAFFNGDSSFSTWLYRLTVNSCIDHLRRNKRRNATPFSALEDENQTLNIPDTRNSPEEIAELGELKDALKLALQTLSDEHRMVFILRAVNGLSYTEIAEILDLEEGTVKSRLSRARERLRRELEKSGNIKRGGASNSVKGGEKA